VPTGSPGRTTATRSPTPGTTSTVGVVTEAPARSYAVTFRLFAAARAAAGTGEVHVPPGPVSEVVADLLAALPDRFAEVLAVSSLVADGHRLDRTAPTPLDAGAVVDILPPFAGG